MNPEKVYFAEVAALFVGGAILLYCFNRLMLAEFRKKNVRPYPYCSAIGLDQDRSDENRDEPPAHPACDRLPDHYDSICPIESYIVRKRNGVRYYSDDRVNYGEPTELYSRIPMRVFLGYADLLGNDAGEIARAMGEGGMFVDYFQARDALIYAGRSAKAEEAADDGLIAR